MKVHKEDCCKFRISPQVWDLSSIWRCPADKRKVLSLHQTLQKRKYFYHLISQMPLSVLICRSLMVVWSFRNYYRPIVCFWISVCLHCTSWLKEPGQSIAPTKRLKQMWYLNSCAFQRSILHCTNYIWTGLSIKNKWSNSSITFDSSFKTLQK